MQIEYQLNVQFFVSGKASGLNSQKNNINSWIRPVIVDCDW